MEHSAIWVGPFSGRGVRRPGRMYFNDWFDVDQAVLEQKAPSARRQERT